ncbi:low choriolytic enzyme-like [Antennarius striatus]|uniref:low choriolytic enzyme-like n=1 Tax=Antennarius striatus TaxID=241820 RepID=UPI0035B0660E
MTPVFLFLSLLAGSTSCFDVQEVSSSISDIIEEVNADIQQNTSSIFEFDDIRVDLPSRAQPCAEKLCTWPKSGRTVTVPYSISPTFRSSDLRVFRAAMLYFHRNTCIVFKPQTNETSFLYFYSGPGCWSYLGYINYVQPISLNKDSCVTVGIVQHQILHALGFHHELNRLDRDQNIHIISRNIQPEKKKNLDKVKTSSDGTPYDYNSIMHYGKYTLSKNRHQTIIATKWPYSLGHARYMSVIDTRRVNKLYQCCETHKC